MCRSINPYMSMLYDVVGPIRDVWDEDWSSETENYVGSATGIGWASFQCCFFHNGISFFWSVWNYFVIKTKRGDVWNIYKILRWKLNFDMRGILGWCHTRSPPLFVRHLNETPVISLQSEGRSLKISTQEKSKKTWKDGIKNGLF